jgi:hypothetical protein
MHSFVVANLNGSYLYIFVSKAEISTANNL